MSANLKVLVSGAGIAGPVAAHFFAQAGAQVTVVERAREVRTGGQNVDVRGHGLAVLRRLGVEETVRAKTTLEKGLRFVTTSDEVAAEFPVGSGYGFTSDIEIMRGDLGSILYEATESKVKYVFDESMQSIEEDETGVEVHFESGESGRFDLVVGADGWASRTRELAFGPAASKAAVRDLDQWAAWFTIPHEPSDDKWARWCNAPGKRMMLVRPDNQQRTRVSLWVMKAGEKMDRLTKAPVDEQKAHWHSIFEDAGWESKRLLAGMKEADDFYMQKIAQVKPAALHQGRVVLVGDAASCPSPISGMGTTVAIVGAYVLAGEIARIPHNLPQGLEKYEERMKQFVEVAQKLAPGAPSMANPNTQLGIRILHLFLGFVAWTGIMSYLGASFNHPSKALDLPLYEFQHFVLTR